jgi:hypothetical protein
VGLAQYRKRVVLFITLPLQVVWFEVSLRAAVVWGEDRNRAGLERVGMPWSGGEHVFFEIECVLTLYYQESN